ncbi:hypothetical protein X975_06181, partial [Stegodyphus mimosarum]
MTSSIVLWIASKATVSLAFLEATEQVAEFSAPDEERNLYLCAFSIEYQCNQGCHYSAPYSNQMEGAVLYLRKKEF